MRAVSVSTWQKAADDDDDDDDDDDEEEEEEEEDDEEEDESEKEEEKEEGSKRQIVALSPVTPKRIWGCWSHYTDTSEPVINQNSHRTIIHTKNADGREMEI